MSLGLNLFDVFKSAFFPAPPQGWVPPTGCSLAVDWLSAGGAVLPAVARRQPSALPAGQAAGPHGRIQPVQCKYPINQLLSQSVHQSINPSVGNGSTLAE